MNLQDKNLTKYDVFPFNELSDESFKPEIDISIEIAGKLIEEVKSQTTELTYSNIIGKIDFAIEALNRVALPLISFRSLRVSDTILSTIKNELPKATKLKQSITTDEVIYQKIKAISRLDDLTTEEQATLSFIEKEFNENGIGLTQENRDKYSSLTESIDELQAEYLENIHHDEEQLALSINSDDELRGIPESILSSALKRAEKDGASKWLFSIKNAEYIPAIKFAESSNFRKKLFEKRASLSNLGEFSNRKTCLKLLQLRLEKAQLLGFENHSEYKLLHTEACTANDILKLLEEYKENSLPNANAELDKLASDNNEIGSIKEWDVHYLKNKEGKSQNDSSELTFEINTLLAGIFSTLSKIFQVSFVLDKNISSYSEENVQVYRLENVDSEVVGVIYLDLFSRVGKRGGNWMGPLKEKGLYDDRVVLPQVVVSTNMLYENRDKISLYEVSRILHEMGHALHAILSSNSLPRLNSVFNCPMSIIELPSKLLENLIKVPGCLEAFLGRPATEDEILTANQSNENPYFDVIQVSNAIYDLKLHSLIEFNSLDNWEEFEKEHLRTDLQNKSFGSDFPIKVTSFRHIMAGGYDVGYYSYILSGIFADQVFNLWQTAGIYNKEFCGKLNSEIYGKGALLDLKAVKPFLSH